MSIQKYNPIPVIIGVGQINDRDQVNRDQVNRDQVNRDQVNEGDEQSTAGSSRDSLGLMEAALRAADRDAGGGWLRRLDSLGVVDQISYPELGDVSVDRKSVV